MLAMSNRQRDAIEDALGAANQRCVDELHDGAMGRHARGRRLTVARLRLRPPRLRLASSSVSLPALGAGVDVLKGLSNT